MLDSERVEHSLYPLPFVLIHSSYFLTPIFSGNLLGAKGKVAADVANHFPRLLLRTIGTPAVSAGANKRVAYGEFFDW